jgi:hypothetical protein
MVRRAPSPPVAPASTAGSPQDATKAHPAGLCPSEDRNAARAIRLAAALAWAELQQHPAEEPAAVVALVIGEEDWARLGGAPESAAVLAAMGNPTRPPAVGVSAWKMADDSGMFPAGSVITCDSARAVSPDDVVVCEIAGVGVRCARWRPAAGPFHAMVELYGEAPAGRSAVVPRPWVRWMVRAVEVREPLRAV